MTRGGGEGEGGGGFFGSRKDAGIFLVRGKKTGIFLWVLYLLLARKSTII